MRRRAAVVVALLSAGCRQIADVHDDVEVGPSGVAGASGATTGGKAGTSGGSSGAGGASSGAGAGGGGGCPASGGAPLVRVGDVCIDAHEATRGEALAVLATKPKPPAGPCANATVTAPLATGEADTFPARGVTFCTAAAYCAAVGKRLCRTGALDEWTAACTGNEPGRVYTYGDTYDPKRCVADQYHADTSCKDDASCKPVDALAPTKCDDGFGVVHLSGNVQEWIDACADGFCELRGGSFEDYGSDTACAPAPGAPRTGGIGDVIPSAGVRCCGGP